jgi:hypothetical protein
MEHVNRKRKRRRLRAPFVRSAGHLTLTKCLTLAVTLARQLIALVRTVTGH